MKRFLLLISASIAAVLLATVPYASAQGNEPGIWRGIFTDAQAERGKVNFTQSCVRCHGADLAGVTAPSLNGKRFIAAWENESLYKLFTKVRDTMPPNFGTILTDEDKLDVITYILRTNGFPTGSQELKVDADTLEGVQILPKGASQAVTNFSIVRVVGCLTPGPNNTWLLNDATEPVLSRDQPSTPDELRRADGMPHGRQTFRLVSVAAFDPQQHSGHKLDVRGLLYRDENDARINVTTLQMAGVCN